MALLSHPKIPRPHHKALSSHSPPSPPHPLCSNVSYPLHPCPLRCVQLFLFALPVLWHILTRSDTRAGRASRPSVENWDRVVTQLSQLSLPAASADASFEWLESASAQSHSSASPTSPSTTFTSDLDVLSPSSSRRRCRLPLVDRPGSVLQSPHHRARRALRRSGARRQMGRGGRRGEVRRRRLRHGRGTDLGARRTRDRLLWKRRGGRGCFEQSESTLVVDKDTCGRTEDFLYV